MLKRGMGGSAGDRVFRSKYGEKILSAPTTQGFNLLAWIMPFAAILAGGALVALRSGAGARKRRRRQYADIRRSAMTPATSTPNCAAGSNAS